MNPNEPNTDIGSVLYVCNVQHQNSDGTWYTHQGVTKRTKEGVAHFMELENQDIGGGLIARSKSPRRLMVRTVTIGAVEFQKLR